MTWVHFFSRAPVLGLSALLGALVCSLGTAAVLASSDGKEYESWPSPDLSVQPSVVLSVLTASVNAMLLLALHEGATISWWIKMMLGGSLNDCHRYWNYSNSVWAAVTSGRHFNKVALACLMAAIVVIDGPILQRASTVRSIQVSNPRNFSMALNQNLLDYTTGWYTSRAKMVDTLSDRFARVLAGYNSREPIVLRAEGCRGTCHGEIIAPGWEVECSNGAQKALGMPEIADKVDIGSISVEFGGVLNTSVIIVSTLFMPQGMEHNLATSKCTMQFARVRHPVELSNGTVTLSRLPLSVNRTVERQYPRMETAGLGIFPSTLGGIAFAVGKQYNSKISIYNGGGLQVSANGMMGYAYRNSSDDALGTVGMTWADPTADVVAAIQELTFRAAAFHSNATTPMQRIEGHETMQITVYTANYRYLAGGLVLMIVATLAMLPLFHGWWHLGREVTLSPVEIAVAFRAPHTEGGDPNADVYTLLRQIGKRKARYGVIDENGVMRYYHVSESQASFKRATTPATFKTQDIALQGGVISQGLSPELGLPRRPTLGIAYPEVVSWPRR
ncbi:hypothetical protein DL766_010181 [Monosporascus sp. MC13-8B]|uniref:Uncharacterized protein n=1 Tax=Monosporascus cannonballus TaxID=155416 RepID=A0ABY0GZ53_9PEZI|nr:hypothetical protein DL762_007499 [Monosporascus cannonballus]RYO82738.1 hypothetical protein DL763_008127 [Monosporascus cannonballus]RYP08549.1 hypothetical protein DL766_010181 [Monosporascus sp. MC13-8B]